MSGNQLLAATTRFKDPDTGKLLGVPEAVADHKVTAGTRYAPQWQLDGYASAAEAEAARTGAVGAPSSRPAPQPASPASMAPVPVAEAHEDELAAVLTGQTAVVDLPTPVLTPAQQRMAHARAARGKK